jgi:hypothetical protein
VRRCGHATEYRESSGQRHTARVVLQPVSYAFLTLTYPQAMTEAQYREVERVLLCIGDARARAARARDAVQRDAPDAQVTGALAAAERDLGELHRRLMQQTYYAIPQPDAASRG